jgi:hypothetical protein
LDAPYREHGIEAAEFETAVLIDISLATFGT